MRGLMGFGCAACGGVSEWSRVDDDDDDDDACQIKGAGVYVFFLECV
jgi:hypothetical protein